ncbi:MAG: hypothetical protein ACPL7J_08825, partial [Desulfomonilaceae bacterium]
AYRGKASSLRPCSYVKAEAHRAVLRIIHEHNDAIAISGGFLPVISGLARNITGRATSLSPSVMAFE